MRHPAQNQSWAESRQDPQAPKVPPGAVSAELLPTAAESAASALSDWIAKNPHVNAGGARILDDLITVVVYWKGSPPVGLRELANSQRPAVTFKAAAYSRDELVAVGKKLVTDHMDIVDSAGPSSDYSSVTVTLRSTAPPAALAEMQAETSVPLVVDGVRDSVNLGGAKGTVERSSS